MHEMFSYVLNKKDLSKAGELFQVADGVILSDLTEIISKIIEITSQPDYSHNLNDQSVVEICITRITSVIRENGSVELQGLALVSLLQTCLNHNLRPTAPDVVPPHAKIAADIVACIFLHYQQRLVMTVALPVAVKLLHKGNTELSRSISSYLSLAATHSAPLLAQHTHTVVDSVIAGNYSLARILPGLYSEAQEPLHRHVLTLVSLLPRCPPPDCPPLLQLFALVAAHRPALLENSLPQLLDCLPHRDALLPTLQVVLLLAQWRPSLLSPYLARIMGAVDGQPDAVALGLQVVLVGGRVSAELARASLDFTGQQLPVVEKSGLPEVLREVGAVVSLYPDAASDELLRAVRGCHTAAATTHTALVTLLADRAPHTRDRLSSNNSSNSIKHSNSGGITIVTVNSNTHLSGPANSSNSNVRYTSNHGLEQLNNSRHDIRGSRDQVLPGSRGRDLARSTSRELTNGGRVSDLLLARLPEGLYQQHGGGGQRQNKYQKHSSGVTAGGEAWRSTSRLGASSNRSMPRLNAASGGAGSNSRLGSSTIQLNKSLTRLNTSQHGVGMTRSITALTTQPARPLSTPHPSSALAACNGGSYCATIDASGPYALGPELGLPALSHPLSPNGGAPFPSVAVTPNQGFNLNASGAPPSNKRSLSHLSGGSPTKASQLQQAIQAVVSGPQRLSHIITSAGGSHYSTALDSAQGTSASSLSSSPSKLSYSTGIGSTVGAPSKLLTSDPTCSSSGTYSPVNSADLLPYKLSSVTEPSSHPVAHGSPGKSRTSSTGTLRDCGDGQTQAGSQCSGFPSSSTTTTTITTTATTTPLTTSSSAGAVTSTSSGSVCDSAGSLTAASTNPTHLNNNNNNHISGGKTGAATLGSRYRRRTGGGIVSAPPLGEGIDPGPPLAPVMRGAGGGGGGGGGCSGEPQRASVFEPFAMKDTVQHFCEKHRDKIKAFMQKVFVKLPLPVKCLIEERKRRKYAKLFFGCQGKGEHCLYNTHLFCIKVRHPRVWIHLMFLALQARSPSALSSRETQVSSLRHCWDTINNDINVTFLTLVTAAFPSAKDMDALMQELRTNRFFDVFEYNGLEQQWGCFLCNHPDKAQGFVQEDTPVIEGQLKEKKSKWKFFRKWRTRYFTLSGAHLSYRGEREDRMEEKGDIDVQQIRSVKVSKTGRHIPKAFEIFTDNKSFVLKAKDSSNAEEWVRCLSIVVAQQHVREKSSGGSGGALYSSNSVPLHHSAPSHRGHRPGHASTGLCTNSSSSVWPGGCTSSRVSSSNTSLPRSLLYSPHGGVTGPSPASSPPPHLQHSGLPTNGPPPPPFAALLSQHAAAAAAAPYPKPIHLGGKPSSSTLPPGMHLVRSNV